MNAYQVHRMTVLGTRIRSCLMSAIYRKSLALSTAARKNTTVGEIVNLMSVDAQRFMDMLPWFNFLISGPFQIAIAICLLWFELGIAVLGGLAVMIALIPINASVSIYMKRYQTKQMSLKDERIKSMNEILSGIKVLKLYAWEKAFIERILKIRSEELSQLKKMGYIGVIVSVLSSCSPFFVAFTTFIIYVYTGEDHVLTAERAFVSISLFNLLKIPLFVLPNMITNLVMVSEL